MKSFSLGRRNLTSVTAVFIALALVAGSQTANADSQPTRGGSVTVVTPADPQPANIFAPRAGNSAWWAGVFEPLTRRDPKTSKPQPVLATSWKIAKDGLSINIKLRKGVTFQSGKPFTAQDVKFTFQKVTDPTHPAQFAFVAQQFTEIDVTGPLALTIKFKTPLSNIFDFFEGTPIVDSQTFAGLADGSKVIGTGPYKFTNWKPGASFVLQRYDGYWNKSAAYLDTINYAVISDGTAQVSALRSQRALISGLSASDAVNFQGDSGYSLALAGGYIATLGMDITKAPFTNQSVRQAVGFAIDRNRINKQVAAGLGTPTDLFWRPSEPGYVQSQPSLYTYNPAKAKKMISDAGFAGASVPIVIDAVPLWQSIFEILQNNLAAVGLVATAVTQNDAQFNQGQTGGEMGPAFLNIHGQVGLSAASLISSTPALRPTNPSKFYPAQYQTLRQNLLATTTKPASAKALAALSAYMLDQAFTQPILQAPNAIVISKQLLGMAFTVNGSFLFGSAYLAK